MSIGGKNSTFKHGTHGAISSNTNFTGKMRQASPAFDAETVDATVWGDGYRAYEQSFKNGTLEARYKYDPTVFGQLAAIYDGGDVVTFEFGPDGTDAGKPKVTGHMFIKSFSNPVEIGNLLEIPVSWQLSGAVTFDTF